MVKNPRRKYWRWQREWADRGKKNDGETRSRERLGDGAKERHCVRTIRKVRPQLARRQSDRAKERRGNTAKESDKKSEIFNNQQLTLNGTKVKKDQWLTVGRTKNLLSTKTANRQLITLNGER
jgi:hypothetical protein